MPCHSSKSRTLTLEGHGHHSIGSANSRRCCRGNTDSGSYLAVKPGTEDGLDILAMSATILLRLFASYVAPTANFKIASAKVLTYFGSGGYRKPICILLDVPNSFDSLRECCLRLQPQILYYKTELNQNEPNQHQPSQSHSHCKSRRNFVLITVHSLASGILDSFDARQTST